MEHLGLPLPDSDLEFPITTADEDAYCRLEEARALKPDTISASIREGAVRISAGPRNSSPLLIGSSRLGILLW